MYLYTVRQYKCLPQDAEDAQVSKINRENIAHAIKSLSKRDYLDSEQKEVNTSEDKEKTQFSWTKHNEQQLQLQKERSRDGSQGSQSYTRGDQLEQTKISDQKENSNKNSNCYGHPTFPLSKRRFSPDQGKETRRSKNEGELGKQKRLRRGEESIVMTCFTCMV